MADRELLAEMVLAADPVRPGEAGVWVQPATIATLAATTIVAVRIAR
ncbi:MAG TPA: hypothetical protein VFW65_21850 [Pseudonocardiaceae bacterium]|nr:hypothetical protein [Pseudonocardiaceae bacterium]